MSPDLDTLGKETFDGQLPAGITAHPKIDPATGEMAVFCYALEPPLSDLVGHRPGRSRTPGSDARRGRRRTSDDS
jgi:carotenoid cleavage dioxygenase-like enzyme